MNNSHHDQEKSTEKEENDSEYEAGRKGREGKQH